MTDELCIIAFSLTTAISIKENGDTEKAIFILVNLWKYLEKLKTDFSCCGAIVNYYQGIMNYINCIAEDCRRSMEVGDI